jgi:hypothetical protein
MKVRRARLRGRVERHADAIALLKEPGDMALVERGVRRLLVFACPDGCGDVVPVNLDPRAGKAWRYYDKGNAVTLYPSVWRDEGCRAHFILWNDTIYWSGFGPEVRQSDALRQAVRQALRADEFRSYADIAVELNEIPWAVWVACDELVARGAAIEAPGHERGRYRLQGQGHRPQRRGLVV